MKILFFTEISPFPVNGGERIRSYGLLKALSELNHSVVAVIQNSDHADLSQYSLKNITYIEYSIPNLSTLENLLGFDFFSLNKDVLQIFDDQLLHNRPDIAFLDFYQAGKYYRYFKKAGIPYIIGTHNFESNLIWQKPSKTIFHYLRKVQRFCYMRIHERFFYRQCKALVTVSDNDTVYYSKYHPKDKIFMVPNFLDESKYTRHYVKENYIAMTANFGPYMNLQGLRWLVNDVWDAELDQQFELRLIGKQSKEALASIPAAGKYKNIVAIGEVEDMVPYISKAKMVLIPLLHGSGTRLKCLEAMALKTPIISTSKGVEGIKSKNVMIANTSVDFKKAISQYRAQNGSGEKLHDEFMAEYSLKRNILRVKELLES